MLCLEQVARSKIKEYVKLLILFIVGYILIGFMVASLLQIAFGYNMTDDLIEEERQLILCINWKIENKSCSQIYGGIDGANGEPIK